MLCSGVSKVRNHGSFQWLIRCSILISNYIYFELNEIDYIIRIENIFQYIAAYILIGRKSSGDLQRNWYGYLLISVEDQKI